MLSNRAPNSPTSSVGPPGVECAEDERDMLLDEVELKKPPTTERTDEADPAVVGRRGRGRDGGRSCEGEVAGEATNAADGGLSGLGGRNGGGRAESELLLVSLVSVLRRLMLPFEAISNPRPTSRSSTATAAGLLTKLPVRAGPAPHAPPPGGPLDECGRRGLRGDSCGEGTTDGAGDGLGGVLKPQLIRYGLAESWKSGSDGASWSTGTGGARRWSRAESNERGGAYASRCGSDPGADSGTGGSARRDQRLNERRFRSAEVDLRPTSAGGSRTSGCVWPSVGDEVSDGENAHG